MSLGSLYLKFQQKYGHGLEVVHYRDKMWKAAWANHNYRALNLIPSDRLLILRTNEITTSLERIAKFLDIPVTTLDLGTTHSFRAPQKHHILASIDPTYVRDQAEKYCSELMERFFPDQDYLKLLYDQDL